MRGQPQPEPASPAEDAVHGRARRVAAIAERQQGVVTRRQLLAAGLGRGAIDNWVKTGRLFLRHRGVYLLGHRAAPPFAVEMAAVLACGRDSLLGGLSATRAWAMLRRPADPRPISVLVVGRVVRSRDGILVSRTADLPTTERSTLDGVPITSPARTLLDLASQVDSRILGRALNEAGVLGLTTPADLRSLLDRRPRHRGASRLRALVDPVRAPSLTRSEAERRLLDLIRAAGLPRPRTNVRVGPFEVDALWPRERLVVEVDGFRFHSSRAAFERDRARDAELTARGFRVIRVTWRQLVDEPYAVVARIAQALGSAA